MPSLNLKFVNQLKRSRRLVTEQLIEDGISKLKDGMMVTITEAIQQKFTHFEKVMQIWTRHTKLAPTEKSTKGNQTSNVVCTNQKKDQRDPPKKSLEGNPNNTKHYVINTTKNESSRASSIRKSSNKSTTKKIVILADKKGKNCINIAETYFIKDKYDIFARVKPDATIPEILNGQENSFTNLGEDKI